MASPAFGTLNTGGGSSAADVTVNVPASTADGDILLFGISKDATGAITPPAGWNFLAEETSDTSHMYVSWRRASGDTPGTGRTWTFAATWRDAVILRYTGAVSTGDPIDPDPPTAMTHVALAGNNGNLSTGSITTATADTTLVAFHNSKTLSSWSAVTSGMTLRTSAGAVEIHVMDVAQAVAGASGTKNQAFAGGDGPMKGYLIALASVASGGADPFPLLPPRTRVMSIA